MLKLRYSYKTRITFSENVYSHHFLLRCTPWTTESQHIVESNCTVLPQNNLCVGNDSFGNIIFTGFINEFHNYFEFISTGVVLLSSYCIREELNPVYRYPSNYTQPMQRIMQIYEQLNFSSEASEVEKVYAISRKIHELISYEPGVTSIKTTANDALELGKGVCQDYAHIMISLCRKCGIPARYVTGFMQGEGFTHAWIEYYANGVWYGFDPTHDRAIETGYIKIAHGRDYADCAVDGGVFRGLAQQKLEVFLNVEIEQ